MTSRPHHTYVYTVSESRDPGLLSKGQELPTLMLISVELYGSKICLWLGLVVSRWQLWFLVWYSTFFCSFLVAPPHASVKSDVKETPSFFSSGEVYFYELSGLGRFSLWRTKEWLTIFQEKISISEKLVAFRKGVQGAESTLPDWAGSV